MPLVVCEDVRTPLGALRVVFGIGHFQILCHAARARPEGYTVSIGNTSAVYPVQYDALKDFEAIVPTAQNRLRAARREVGQLRRLLKNASEPTNAPTADIRRRR